MPIIHQEVTIRLTLGGLQVTSIGGYTKSPSPIIITSNNISSGNGQHYSYNQQTVTRTNYANNHGITTTQNNVTTQYGTTRIVSGNTIPANPGATYGVPQPIKTYVPTQPAFNYTNPVPNYRPAPTPIVQLGAGPSYPVHTNTHTHQPAPAYNLQNHVHTGNNARLAAPPAQTQNPKESVVIGGFKNYQGENPKSKS